VERKMMIWLLCFTAILLEVVDALTTYVGLTSPYFQEENPYMAQLFTKYGETNPFPHVIATVCPSLAVICMSVNGVVLSRKYMWAEQLTYYALFFINIISAYVGWWNTVQLLLFWR